jgi:prepilin-type N-terminal cleavage/methylation domain-containing protein
VINKKKRAFTLTEVLIALSLMGVILACTVPTLNSRVENRSYAPALKKIYSTLSDATSNIMLNNSGTLANSFVGATPAIASRYARDNANMFAKTLEYTRTCNSGAVISGGCWAASTSKLSGGASVEGFVPEMYEGAVLADGTLLLFRITNNSCDGMLPAPIISPTLPYNADNNVSCGSIMVDLNGVKVPNRIGRDIFLFALGANGIFPGGEGRTEFNNQQVECNPASNAVDGYGCAGRVLDEGEMNY